LFYILFPFRSSLVLFPSVNLTRRSAQQKASTRTGGDKHSETAHALFYASSSSAAAAVTNCVEQKTTRQSSATNRLSARIHRFTELMLILIRCCEIPLELENAAANGNAHQKHNSVAARLVIRLTNIYPA